MSDIYTPTVRQLISCSFSCVRKRQNVLHSRKVFVTRMGLLLASNISLREDKFGSLLWTQGGYLDFAPHESWLEHLECPKEV